MARGNARHELGKIIRKEVRATLVSIGQDYRDTVRDLVSVPVTYAGSEVIRSEPGEPPTREFNRLWRSITYRVAAKAQNVEALRVFSDEGITKGQPISAYLEGGTSTIEPRPHWAPAKETVGDIVAEFRRRLAARLKAAGVSPRSYNSQFWRK